MFECKICCHKLDNKPSKYYGGYAIIKCNSCGSFSAFPISDNLKTSIEYLYEDRSFLVGQYLSWAHFDFLKIHPQGKTLLDIGTGTGDFINLANKQGYDAIGIEMDDKAVKAGNEHWKFDKIIQSNGLDYLKNTDKKWDIITLFAVIEHVTNPYELMQEIVKRINPNGYVSITVQNMDSPCAHWWANLTPGHDYPPNHYTRWSYNGLVKFLARFGMIITDRSTVPAGLLDIFPDTLGAMFGKYPFVLKNSLRLFGYAQQVLTPIERVILKPIKEGRAQMVIARKNEK